MGSEADCAETPMMAREITAAQSAPMFSPGEELEDDQTYHTSTARLQAEVFYSHPAG